VKTIAWIGAISDTRTAIQASGKNEGGGKITFDVPESEIAVIGYLLALRECGLRITVEVVG
jgi:hypothetical protein